MITAPENIRPLPLTKPLLLLTGFLGAGKTTFLRKLLTALKPWQVNADVILNDYENAHIDAETLRDTAASVEAIAASCACCEGLEFLVDLSISANASRNDILLVEVNGTADPIPLLESFILLESKLRRNPRWQVCVIDARNLGNRGAYRSLEELQLETASHFHLSHADGISKIERNHLYERIRAINPTASEITPERMAEELAKAASRDMRLLLDRKPPQRDRLFSPIPSKGRATAHQFTGCQILLPDRLSRSSIWSWLAALPPSVIRAKALATVDGEPGIRRLFERVGVEIMGDPFEVPISPRVPASAILIGPDLDPDELLEITRRELGEECHLPD
ncbi:GTP-binding protein [Luteolibacter sp. AS25]|uniref:GTP-binding protein n=1 Tax=Luteolibacter sp. AS25 TaxID=3135776 RepID=UPI00398AC24E